ncbi:hypothetical protein PsorP6_004648 [Peronosclerospora sorghi]|uniref:Uncharacterized protein n=1 Tax=Peronosclerospora sorghi TaxID=230839 RepID=A0ACC0VMQ0_9STRA|nr:hypothetical protein PsorP6_004648 [Peronosclerospora sorghi]
MEIDSAQHFHPSQRPQGPSHFNRDNYRASKFCRYCKKTGHEIDQCFKLKNRNSASPSQQQPQQQFQRRPERKSINYFDEMASDDEEEVAAIEVEDITIAESIVVSDFAGKYLIIKHDNCDNEAAKILFDSGATCNVVKPGYLKRPTSSKTLQVNRFDGSNTVRKNVREGYADIVFEGHVFKDLPVIVWQMEHHDVILGKPWFSEYQPVVNWRTNEVRFDRQAALSNSTICTPRSEFDRKVKTSIYQ